MGDFPLMDTVDYRRVISSGSGRLLRKRSNYPQTYWKTFSLQLARVGGWDFVDWCTVKSWGALQNHKQVSNQSLHSLIQTLSRILTKWQYLSPVCWHGHMPPPKKTCFDPKISLIIWFCLVIDSIHLVCCILMFWLISPLVPLKCIIPSRNPWPLLDMVHNLFSFSLLVHLLHIQFGVPQDIEKIEQSLKLLGIQFSIFSWDIYLPWLKRGICAVIIPYHGQT